VRSNTGVCTIGQTGTEPLGLENGKAVDDGIARITSDGEAHMTFGVDELESFEIRI
jgi:hypothetical protein